MAGQVGRAGVVGAGRGEAEEGPGAQLRRAQGGREGLHAAEAVGGRVVDRGMPSLDEIFVARAGGNQP